MSAKGTIEPTVPMLPPAAPLTCHEIVTLEFVVVLSDRFTTAVKVVVVFKGTVIVVGEIVTDVIVVEPLPLPPQLAESTIAASVSARSARGPHRPPRRFPFEPGMVLDTASVLEALTRIAYPSPGMKPVG